MASHVVVMDNTLRRHTIKTTPNKPLTDVLREACSKFNLDSDKYGLKHGDKTVDLSRTIRISGLTAGAKLTLVQASKSPSVVSIALQLPPSSDTSGSLARLTDKFPSNTPLWQVLRRFESGVAGGAQVKTANYNFTQRATPQMSANTPTGAGRLCYEMPVINIMGRELASFAELQKTLSQVGFNSGSALLRLTFRRTEQPLEEAMTHISQYFQEVDEPPSKPTNTESGAHAGGPGNMQSVPDFSNGMVLDDQAREPSPADPSGDSPMPDAVPAPVAEGSDVIASSSITEPTTETSTSMDQPESDSISIFRPPTSSTPAAATPFNENDYIPTIDHAKQHQARLNQEGRNRRLLSDKEIASQEESRAEALASVKQVIVRLRFPDQSQAQRSFDQMSTVSDVYGMCRELMSRPNDESFKIRVSGKKGVVEELHEGERKLIGDLGWQGRVLATVTWGDDVSARTRQKPSLKEQYRQKAEELKVELPTTGDEDNESVSRAVVKGEGPQSKKHQSSEDKETKMRRFLGKMGKK